MVSHNSRTWTVSNVGNNVLLDLSSTVFYRFQSELETTLALEGNVLCHGRQTLYSLSSGDPKQSSLTIGTVLVSSTIWTNCVLESHWVFNRCWFLVTLWITWLQKSFLALRATHQYSSRVLLQHSNAFLIGSSEPVEEGSVCGCDMTPCKESCAFMFFAMICMLIKKLQTVTYHDVNRYIYTDGFLTRPHKRNEIFRGNESGCTVTRGEATPQYKCGM